MNVCHFQLFHTLIYLPTLRLEKKKALGRYPPNPEETELSQEQRQIAGPHYQTPSNPSTDAKPFPPRRRRSYPTFNLMKHSQCVKTLCK